MNFSFSDEQNLIQRQVEQFIQRDYDWGKRQSLVSSEVGFSEENWKTLYHTKAEVRTRAFEHARVDGFIVEYGVDQGKSFIQICDYFKKD